jgi:rhodanese-related sulfurtransferase
MKQLIARAFLIGVAGAALGVIVNALSPPPRGLPLIATPKKPAAPDEFIPLTKAHELWQSGAAFFLDAREPEDFAAGHIGNALNLPVQSFDKHLGEVMPLLAPDSQLIVYCDGVECELSHRLEKRLREIGFTNVHVLFNGWTAWRGAGFPTQQGVGK